MEKKEQTKPETTETNVNQEQKADEKPVKKARQEKREEFKMNHPKITAAGKKLAKAGKCVLKGALITGGGILTATAILKREKKHYATIPLAQKDPAPQLDATEGVDFREVDPAPQETTETEMN